MTEQRYTISERFFRGSHGPMRYWESEPGEGPPLLLVHGYGGLIEHWRAVLRPLARTRKLFALDLYGFGRSAIPRNALPSRALWSAQIAEFVRGVAKQPVILVGHSMGGMVAAQFAADHPDLLAGLALVDATGVADPEASMSALDDLFFGLVRAPLLGDLLAPLAVNPLAVRQGLLAAYQRQARVDDDLVRTFLAPLQRNGGAQWYLATTRAFPSLLLDLTRPITTPATLIWGEYDRSVPPSTGRRFQQTLLPHADLHVIPETGHCPFDEDPAAFCAILSQWADQIAPLRAA